MRSPGHFKRLPAHENAKRCGSAAGRRGAGCGKREKRIGSATCISRRASGAPMQKWMPAPKAMLASSGRARIEAVGLRASATDRDWRRRGAGRSSRPSGAGRPRPRPPPAHSGRRNAAAGRSGAPPRRGRPLNSSLEKSAAGDSSEFQNRLHRIADRMHGRLVAGVEKLDRAGDQLVLRELFARRLRGDQMCDQVVARLLPPRLRRSRAGTRRIPASP